METLMTPAEVATVAFPGSLDPEGSFVPVSSIVAAQQKFLKPALNGLYERLEQGAYVELLEEYVKPALAHYVRYLLLPTISAQVGTTGVVQPRSASFGAASDKAVEAIRRRTRSDAAALMRRLIEHIETLAADYPEYDPAQNVLNRVSTAGGIVL